MATDDRNGGLREHPTFTGPFVFWGWFGICEKSNTHAVAKGAGGIVSVDAAAAATDESGPHEHRHQRYRRQRAEQGGQNAVAGPTMQLKYGKNKNTKYNYSQISY